MILAEIGKYRYLAGSKQKIFDVLLSYCYREIRETENDIRSDWADFIKRTREYKVLAGFSEWGGNCEQFREYVENQEEFSKMLPGFFTDYICENGINDIFSDRIDEIIELFRRRFRFKILSENIMPYDEFRKKYSNDEYVLKEDEYKRWVFMTNDSGYPEYENLEYTVFKKALSINGTDVGQMISEAELGRLILI